MPRGKKKVILSEDEDLYSDEEMKDVPPPPISKRSIKKPPAKKAAAVKKRKRIESSEEEESDSGDENQEIDLENSSEGSLYSDEELNIDDNDENMSSVGEDEDVEEEEEEEEDERPKKKSKTINKPSAKPKATPTRGSSKPPPKNSNLKIIIKSTNASSGSSSGSSSNSSAQTSPRSPSIPIAKRKGAPGRKKSIDEPNQTIQHVTTQDQLPNSSLPSNLPFKNPKFQYVIDSNKKQWKSIKQIISNENSSTLPATFPTYENIEVSQTLIPSKKYCDITGLSANYTDPKSSMRYYDSSIYQLIQKFPDDLKLSYLSLRGKGSMYR